MRLLGTKLGSISTGRGLGDSLYDTAAAVPSLDLRFSENKSLVDATTGQNLVTFSRASEATFVNSQGLIETAANNAPRFDHNPTTGESLGLLVEEERTNLLLRSEEFDQSPWLNVSGGPAVTANYSTAPSGQQTADRLVFDAADKGLSQSITYATIGVVYTASVYIKGIAGQTIRFSPVGGIGTATNVTLSANWQRFSISGAATGTTVGFTINTFGGATARDVEVWGAQLEAGAFPTSYIPTTASAATRAADVASISGSNFSSWYRQDEGTVFAEAQMARQNALAGAAVCGAETGVGNAEAIYIHYRGSGATAAIIWDNSSLQANFFPYNSAVPANTITRMAIGARLNDSNAAGGGVLETTDTSCTMPTPDRLLIGYSTAGSSYLSGHIRRLTFWPQRLPNATLQAITQ